MMALMKKYVSLFCAQQAPLWLKALRTSVLLVVSYVGLDRVILPSLPSRALTASETHMLRNVFRDSVDYKKVRIHHSRAGDQWMHIFGAAAMTRHNMITLHSNTCSADYSRCPDATMRHVFLHEAVHVWQGQNNLAPLRISAVFGHYSRLLNGVPAENHYSYSLQGQHSFTSYNIEQQAGIIADYYTYVKDAPNTDATSIFIGLNKDVRAGYNHQADYVRVLTPFLHNPAYVRK